jgi:D-alanyl-D-alanine carboxypeptidase
MANSEQTGLIEARKSGDSVTKLVAALVTLLALNGVSVADPLNQALIKAVQRGWPGVGVLVQSAHGKVRIATAGLANIESNTPMSAATGFHMCSINKTFTAAAILRLIDQGMLSLDSKVVDILDQPVVKRIPNIVDITVAELLDHSSGIYPTNNDPTYVNTLVGSGAFMGRVWTPVELIELATHPENKPAAMPGEGHHYSDTNYILLGLIAERVSHEPLKAYIAHTILDPLDMRATYFHSDVLLGKRRTPPTVANGYIKLTKDLTDAVVFNPGFKSPRPGLLNTSTAAERIDAAAGLVTTLADLHKFANALFRGKLLSPKSQAFLFAVRDEMAGAELGKPKTRALQGAVMPFGIVLFKEGDGAGGFNTLMAFHPRSDTIFIGFTNEFGNFDEVDLMMDVMSKVIPPEMADRLGLRVGSGI